MKPFKFTLSKKLFSSLTAFALFPLIIAIVVLLFNSTKGVTYLIDSDIKKTSNAIERYFEQIASEYLVVAQVFAENKEFITSLKEKDRSQLEVQVAEVYSNLTRTHHLKVFEFGDEKGIVFFRGHQPDKFGDDKSGLHSIQEALKGNSVAGFEFGKSGLAVRSFVPIKDGNKIIGTMQIGSDDSFLINLKETLDVDLSLYDKESILIKTTNEESQDELGQAISDKTIFERVSTGEQVTNSIDKGIIHTYLPIYDPTKSNVIGMVEIKKDISFISQLGEESYLLSLVLILGTLVGAIIFSLMISRSITKPIAHLGQFMDQISMGNLNVQLEGKYKEDELGILAKQTLKMSQDLRSIIAQVATTSEQVAAISEELSYGSKDTSETASKVSATVHKVTELTGDQLSKANRTVQSMQELQEVIQNIALTTTKVTHTSDDMTNKSELGHHSIRDANDQMNSIHSNVKELHEVISSLGIRSKNIGEILDVITTIADQTNLLALNAAIEAARAGEHGRGFSIVADEVRKLAEQSHHSANQISALIREIQSEIHSSEQFMGKVSGTVQEGISIIHRVGDQFNSILHSSKEVSQQLNEVAITTKTMTSTSEQVSDVVQEVANMSIQVETGAKEISASAHEQVATMDEFNEKSERLNELAQELKNKVNQFKM